MSRVNPADAVKAYACACERTDNELPTESTSQWLGCSGTVAISVIDDIRNDIVRGQRLSVLVWHPDL